MDNPKDSKNLDLAAETARSKKRASQVVVFSISRLNIINIHNNLYNNTNGGLVPEDSGSLGSHSMEWVTNHVMVVK